MSTLSSEQYGEKAQFQRDRYKRGVLQQILEVNINPGVPGLSTAISTSTGIIWKSTAGFANIESQRTNRKHTISSASEVLPKYSLRSSYCSLLMRTSLKLLDIVAQYLDKEVFHDIENASTATFGGILSHTASVES